VSKHVFCSDLCLERGEPLIGTGDAPKRILMLAWPRGKWRNPRWESVDMSPELTAALHDASDAGLHVALVDKVEAPGSLPTLHALPENIHASFTDEADIIAAIRGYVDGKLFEGRPDHRPTIICCTDSRRDACCARDGFSTYKALVKAADPAKFNIVQATHIGGCRFAASLVVMPARQRYGRMTAEHAEAFLAAIGKGEIYLPTYKGRTDTLQPVQVAEHAAQQWAAERGHYVPAISLSGDIPQGAGHGASLTLNALLPDRTLSIRMHAEDFRVQGNCNVVATGGGQTMLRWMLDEIVEEPSA